MPHATRLSIWVIPGVGTLPDPDVETLQVLADLLPFTGTPPRDRSDYQDRDLAEYADAEDRYRLRRDFDAWTAEAARAGLLRWPERDRLVHALADHARRG